MAGAAGFIKKIGGAWIFFIAVCILYGIIFGVDPSAAREAFSVFLNLIKRILPILALVFGLIFLSNLFIDNKLVLRYLGKGSRKRGWIIAVIGGILSAGPIYMWYPLLQDLKQKGMRDALIATFLYNRAVKIPLLPIMILYFGIDVVIILTVSMILFSIADGFIVEKLATVKTET